MKKNEKMLRKIITLKEKENHGFILPKVKFNLRKAKKNKSEVEKIKKIKFNTDKI